MIIDGFGKSVAKRDNQIVIKENGKEKDYFLAKEVSQIFFTGKGSITFDALSLLAENDIYCASIDWRGHVNYTLSAPDRKNAIVKKEQYFALMDSRSGYLAKSFILAKIENQKAVLGTIAKSRDDNEYLISQKDKLSNHIDSLKRLYVKASDSIRNNIMGIEGQASHEYWLGFADILDDKWGFKGRSGRGAQDPVNSLLNYGYAVVESEIWRSIYLAGLDPYCGFLHSDRYGRASLVFDLIEEFRQQIVDKTVLSIVNKNQVGIDDFEDSGNMILLSEKSRHLLISKILEKLSSKVEFNGNQMSYSDIIMYQGRLMAKFLTHEAQYVGFSRYW